MLFNILRNLQVTANDGHSVPVRRHQHRALLDTLLLFANEPVPNDMLIEALWPKTPPISAIRALRTYIWEVRKLLQSPRIHTHGCGYEIEVRDAELDLHVFRDLDERGHAAMADRDFDTTARLLTKAMSLWAGTPFGDMPHTVPIDSETARWLERRTAAQTSLIDARLRLGQHRDVIADLKALTIKDPLNENTWGQLMLALHRSGRRADALTSFLEIQGRLAQEIGTTPGTHLIRLYDQIRASGTELGSV